MATMHTLLSDLENRAVGMGRELQGGTSHSSIISDAYKIMYLYRNMKVSLSDNVPPRMQFTPAASVEMNGTYLGFRPYWTTVTKIDALRPIVVSSGFAGCEYQVFKSSNSVYCTHVSRDGKDLEKNVALLANYAMARGWKLIQRVETRGIKGDADSVCVISRLSGGGNIKTVRLRLSNMGLVVGCDSFTDTL